MYQWVVGVSGIFLTICYIPQIHPGHWMVAAWMACFATLLEAMPVPLGKARGTLMIALPIGVMVLYGGAEAICLSVFAMAVAPLFQRRSSAFNTWLFNVGQYGLSMCAMLEVYGWMRHGAQYSALDWPTFSAVLMGLLAHVVTNHSLLHVLHVLRGTFEISDLWDLFLADGLNTVVALPLAMLLVSMGVAHELLGPFIVLPMVLVAYLIRLYRQTAVMQRVHLAVSRWLSEFDVKRLSLEAAKTAAELSYADAIVLFVFDEARDRLMPAAFWPANAVGEFSPAGYREADGGLIWSVIRDQHWTYVPNVRRDPRVAHDGFGPYYESMAVFPMVYRGVVQGALVCYSHQTHAFGDWIKYLQTLADQLSVLLDNAKLYQKLRDQSMRDGATGLHNYRYFYEELARRVDQADRFREPVAVAVVDVDFFKKFNDTYGHLAGDMVLRSVGRLLVEMAGPDAVVARYGGEEFALAFSMGADEAFAKMEAIRAAVAHHVVEFEGYRLQGITISTGIAVFPDDADNDRDVLLKADSAMYWGAKQRGRNRTALYSPEFDGQLFIDDLTGLYTFHFLTIKVRQELAAGVRNWGVICVDLERFSEVNATYGFDVGDKILKETSLLVKQSLRQSELACRFGGDEFLIVLPNMTAAELSVVADRVRQSIANHRFGAGASAIITLTAGLATDVLDHVEEAADLFDHVAGMFTSLQVSLNDQSFA